MLLKSGVGLPGRGGLIVSDPAVESRPSPVSTWDLLLALGFTEDQTVMSDPQPGLSFDFGNFKLSASRLVNMRFVPVVLLGGVLVTKQSIGLMENELPLEVESFEQGVAYVAWCLDNAAGGTFEAASAPAWLTEGRRHRHLLPWERQAAAYEARPRCSVRRDWARIAIKALAEQLATVDDNTPVTVWFDGSVLTIRCAEKVCAMPADGHAWTEPYLIRAGALTQLTQFRGF